MTVAVLIVGLDPALTSAVRSSRETFPTLDAETIRAGIAHSRAVLDGLGCETDVCNVDYGATAEAVFRDALDRRRYDVIAIGGGVRLDPALTHLLEMLVNTVHEVASQATIVFNTGPATTGDAVARWVPERSPLTDAGGHDA